MAGRSSFGVQADALLRKNLTFQRRHAKTNMRLISFPIVLCILIVLIQNFLDAAFIKPATNCGSEISTIEQLQTCSIPNPSEWPPMLQVPAEEYRAAKSDVTFLLTGSDKEFDETLTKNMFPETLTTKPSEIKSSLASHVIGSASDTLDSSNFLDPVTISGLPLYSIQSKCEAEDTTTASIQIPPTKNPLQVSCVRGLTSWRDSASAINDEIYKGFSKGNSAGKINEIVGAYDFLNSEKGRFSVTIWYNSTRKKDIGFTKWQRVPRAVNLASNSYLQSRQGPGTQILFEFVKEMPRGDSKLKLDVTAILGSLFFTWVILQLFPVVLTALVYEKEQKLRIMMKMHGLDDGPYWIITYMYFLVISSMYMLCFGMFGAIVGLKIFTHNSVSVQFVFYFIYINLQISVAFLVAALFSSVKTATVLGYIMVFGTGLIGGFLFQSFLVQPAFPRGLLILMELFPGLALYRGLFELGQYASRSTYLGIDAMTWGDIGDRENGMGDVLIIMLVEWLVVLALAYYLDQIISSGGAKGPLFFLQSSEQKKPQSSVQKSDLPANMKPDVVKEREKVEKLLLEPNMSHAIVCDNIRKVYPPRDGNPEKVAVKGMSLAIPPGECFGMLGPNGAGKTSFISMMIGLTTPSSGTAYIQGMDLTTNREGIYTCMGVCPQHDLLWDTLTGREHLLFYGRLKKLEGSILNQAVEEALKSLNLFHGGVADKPSGEYSGGMKRRLSVAIALIGNPKVVYMDEPSTGLDPASRNNLWNVVKQAKKTCAIILTTHSMEEAEALCDRLAFYVAGGLECVGYPKELKARYGGHYVFAITTASDVEEQVNSMINKLSPNAKRIYQLSGTQKFELPKKEVGIAQVFRAVEDAKRNFTVFAWGLADTTLEDVFIKVEQEAQASV